MLILAAQNCIVSRVVYFYTGLAAKCDKLNSSKFSVY